MPLIQCTGCGAAFKVELDTIGQQVKCPKCKTSFAAQVRRSGPRMKQKSAAPIVWSVGIGLGLIAIVAIASLSGDDKPPVTPAADSSTDNAAAKSSAGDSGSRRETSSDPSRPDPGDPRSVVEAFMTTVSQGDASELMNWVNFPLMHDQQGGERWSDMDQNARTLSRMALTERLLGSEDARDFLMRSNAATFEIPEQTADKARAFLVYRDVVDGKTQQEITVHLDRVGDRWFVTGMEAGDIVDPAALAAANRTERKESVRRRGKDRLGVIEKVEHLPETSESQRQSIDQLAAKLADPSLTREASAAKRELAALGKPAIPALLNLIVGREAMATPEDQQILNQTIQVLRDITQLDMGFAPGGMTGSLVGDGQTAEANDTALRKWFGWWGDHKDTWTGPSEDEPEMDEDGP